MAAMYANSMTASALSQQRKAESFILTLEANAYPTFEDAGKYLEKSGLGDKVQVVREALKDVLTAEAELKLHAHALRIIGTTHQVDANAPTDFKAKLDAQKDQLRSSQPYNVEADERLKKFDGGVWSVAHAGETRDLAEDEELVMADDEQPSVNAKCPLTMKPVLELADPVEDPKGYVYDKAAIVAYIRKEGKGRPVKSPVAGTNHTVAENQLKPARAVIKAKRQGKTTRRPAAAPDALEVD